MDDVSAYAGLFLLATGAATIVPVQSEAALAGLILAGRYPVALIAVASAGNILGSTVNWAIGWQVDRFRDRRWFPVRPATLDRAARWYRRYGRWSLLLSWAPVIGDPLTLVAGILREPLWSFLLIVTIAKTVRHILVAALASQWA